MGNMIRDYRLKYRMTQRELASRLGVQQSNVSHWERGKGYPRISSCLEMADMFGCSLDVLLGRELPHSMPKKQPVLYIYGMRLRGFSPGCQPMNGFVERMDYTGAAYYDVLVYNRQLSDPELRYYELDYLYSITGGAT